ncbi:SEL1-like repeat protein [Sphingobacterium sp. Mn56C]|uniref:SEL1-like repeat protein n=1 Tax=Sphingobacterium sp. Mn56C TaxID=3395261 RepID=UPI003BD9BCDC
MHLKNDYQEKLVQIHAALVENPDLSPEDKLSKENFFEYLALFEGLLLQYNSSEEMLSKLDSLFNSLFESSTDYAASLYLDDEDFAFFFDKVLNLLDSYAALNPKAYLEIALQYILTRRTLTDASQSAVYFAKAIEANVAPAKALFLYYNYIKLLNVLPKEEAYQQLIHEAENGDIWALAYYSHFLVWEDDYEAKIAQIEPLKASDNKKIQRHYYETMQHYYARQNKPDMQLQLLNEGIEKTNSAYCKYMRTELQRSKAQTEAEFEALIPAYTESWETGISDSAVQIALLKLQNVPGENPKAADFESAIYHLEKAWQYNHAYAAFRLGCIFLFVESLRDVERGLAYLEEAANRNLTDAKIELAELYAEGQFVPLDENKALSLFQEMAEQGVAYAQYRYGNFMEQGTADQEANFLAAFPWYKKAADNRLPQALFVAGRYIKLGYHGADPNPAEALQYFEKGAQLNSAPCITELGLAAELEETPDYGKAYAYFAQAAALGYPYANYLKGVYLEYDYHQTGSPDLVGAFEAYFTGAQANDSNSTYELARCYRFGIGTEANIDEAIRYYQKSADFNHPRGLTDIGLCYEYGYGVAQNNQKAFEYLEKAAALEYPYAMYVLGRYYIHGLIQQDSEQGLAWLERAAAQQVPEALILLGDYYFYDYDQLGEYDRGFSYYKAAADLDYLSEGLGMCYDFAVGVEGDPQTAFNYYQQAAAQHNIMAMYRLGRAFYYGRGTDVDKEAAYAQFDQAAQSGNLYAKYYAGLQLLEGDGVTQNIAQGYAFIKEAAEAEFAEAQFKLGNCYLMGEGVEEDDESALYWFERAAENGHEEAIKLTKRTRR